MTMRRSSDSSSATASRRRAYSSPAFGSWIEQGPTMTISRSPSPLRMRATSLRARATTCEPLSLSGSSSRRIAGGSRGRMLSTCRSRVFMECLLYSTRVDLVLGAVRPYEGGSHDHEVRHGVPGPRGLARHGAALYAGQRAALSQRAPGDGLREDRGHRAHHGRAGLSRDLARGAPLPARGLRMPAEHPHAGRPPGPRDAADSHRVRLQHRADV